jgi:hypothetical protein
MVRWKSPFANARHQLASRKRTVRLDRAPVDVRCGMFIGAMVGPSLPTCIELTLESSRIREDRLKVID